MNDRLPSSAGMTEHRAAKNSKIFILPDAGLQKGIGCCWRYGNKFTVYPRSQKPSTSRVTEVPSNIFNIRQDVVLFSSWLRTLVNESNGTFLAVQNSAQKNKDSDNSVELLKLSRQYRSIIRVCLENLQEAANTERDCEAKSNILSYITILYSIECIWHLCEILYIDNVPGDVVLPFLLEWVRFHFPCHEQSASQILEACERGSEDHHDYWDTVIGMIIQGRVDVARALLKLHSASETNIYKLVDNSLRTMPVYSVYGNQSSGEFTISWKQWQNECKSKISSGTLASEPNLELIMKLITGEYAAFERVRSKYESWYDVIGGWLLYTDPTVRRFELGKHAQACAAMTATKQTASHLDVILMALMEYDLHQMIYEIQNISDNGWFATHLTDLLYHCDKLKILDQQQVDVTNRLRESLILEYGAVLMEERSLWVVGLSYLTSNRAGVRRAELLLQTLPLGSETRAMRILHEARRLNLHHVAQSICACAGRRALAAGRPGQALAWAARGTCGALASRAADALLRDYAAAGRVRCADLLLSIGPAMLVSDRLVFLCKYCDFHRLYKNREFKAAASLLVSLITSKLTPDYFWPILLVDTLPLLESDEPVFTSAHTFEIMVALEYHCQDLADDEKVELLRLALVRNLARTMLEDDEKMEND